MKAPWEKDDRRILLGNNTRPCGQSAADQVPVFLSPDFNWNEIPCIYIGDHKGDGKAIQLQAWAGPKGSTRLRVPGFLESANEMVSFSALRTGRLYTPGNIPGTHLSEAQSTPRPPGIELATFRPATMCLNQLRHPVPHIVDHMYSSVPTCTNFDFRRTFRNVTCCGSRGVSVVHCNRQRPPYFSSSYSHPSLTLTSRVVQC